MFTLMYGNYTFPNVTFEVRGLPLDNDIRESTIPRMNGSYVQTSYLKSRKIRIRGYLHNTINTTTESQLMDMQAALVGTGIDSSFQYRSDRYINCRMKSIEADFTEGTDKAVMEVNIDLLASNPFFYSTGASYSNVQTHTGGTLSFNFSNGGNAFSEPIIYICATGGTITDGISIMSITDSSKNFRYRGTLNNGLTLKVDSSDFTVLNNGVDGLTNFEGNFLNLLAGTNYFVYSGMTCRITTEYKYRWF